MKEYKQESTMNEFILSASSDLELPEEAVRSATNGLLKLIQRQVDKRDAGQLMQQLRGDHSLLEKEFDETSIPGGTRLTSKIGAIFGENMDAIGGLIGALSKAGLSVEKFGPFATFFVGFLNHKADSELVGKILDQLPDLRKIVS